jgi:hypothetical protein
MNECRNCNVNKWNIEELRREVERLTLLVDESQVRLIKNENHYLRGLLEEILDFEKQTKATYDNFKKVFETRECKYSVHTFYTSSDYQDLFKDHLIPPALVELGNNGVTPPPTEFKLMKAYEHE